MCSVKAVEREKKKGSRTVYRDGPVTIGDLDKFVLCLIGVYKYHCTVGIARRML